MRCAGVSPPRGITQPAAKHRSSSRLQSSVTQPACYTALRSKMRVVQVSRPSGAFEMIERPIPEPGPGTVRIKVQACGVCHSDVLTKEGTIPGLVYPRVPGHEVIGVIDAV